MIETTTEAVPNAPSPILFASEAELPITGTGKPVIDGVRSLVAARLQRTQPQGDGGS
jgi:hypothetical protein